MPYGAWGNAGAAKQASVRTAKKKPSRARPYKGGGEDLIGRKTLPPAPKKATVPIRKVRTGKKPVRMPRALTRIPRSVGNRTREV